MKFSPEYKDDWHRNNIDKATAHHLKMEVGYKDVPAVPVVATQFFDLRPEDKDEYAAVHNLLLYISKHHSQQITKGMKPKQYDSYIKQGSTYIHENNIKMAYDEAEFSPSHELPHYLMSYLLNVSEGVNDNSVFPSYITDLQQKKTELDHEGIRRQYLEESYATAITFNQGENYLFQLLSEMKREGVPFEVAVNKIAEKFLLNEVILEQDYSPEEKVAKMKKDCERCQERFLEVVTASNEERLALRKDYPLECFFYDLCHAYYLERKTDSKAVWNVYQKHFKRLFEKANANPDVYKRKGIEEAIS